MAKELPVAPVSAVKQFDLILNTRKAAICGAMAPALLKGTGVEGRTWNLLRTYALMQFARNEKLQKCSMPSIIQALTDAVVVGLLPGSPLKEGDLVPIWNSRANTLEAHFWPQYPGLVTIARRSGFILDCHAYVVYKNDYFDVDYGREDQIHHKPCLDEPGEMVAAWAKITLRESLNGSGQNHTRNHYEFMRRDELLKIKALALGRMKNPSGPWVDHEGEQWRKTVLKRGLKMCPKSVELARCLEFDNRAETGEEIEIGSADAAVIAAVASEPEAETKTVEGKALPDAPVTQSVAEVAAAETSKAQSVKEEVKRKRGRPRKEQPGQPAQGQGAGAAAPGEKFDDLWECTNCQKMFSPRPDKCNECGHGGFKMIDPKTLGDAAALDEEAPVEENSEPAEIPPAPEESGEAPDGIGQILKLAEGVESINDVAELKRRFRAIADILPAEVIPGILRQCQLASMKDVEKLSVLKLRDLILSAKEEAVGE